MGKIIYLCTGRDPFRDLTLTFVSTQAIEAGDAALVKLPDGKRHLVEVSQAVETTICTAEYQWLDSLGVVTARVAEKVYKPAP